MGTDLKRGTERKNFPGYPMEQGRFRKASEGVVQAQRFISSGSPDLFSSKLLDPPAHSLVSFRFKMQNDVRIFIHIKDGKVFFGVDNHRVLPQSLLLPQGLNRLGSELFVVGCLQIELNQCIGEQHEEDMDGICIEIRCRKGSYPPAILDLINSLFNLHPARV